MDVLTMFFEIYEPWEVEEITCIYLFAKDTIDQVFHDIYLDVHPDNPKSEGHEGHLPSTFDFDREYQFERLSILVLFMLYLTVRV